MASQKIGDLRISDVGAYEGGYFIEQYMHLDGHGYIWAIPAWDEIGWPDLCGPFGSYLAARSALSDGFGR